MRTQPFFTHEVLLDSGATRYWYDVRMPGEADLDILLREMQPVLDDEPYVFISVAAAVVADRRPSCLGLFHEAEGVTLILAAAEAARLDRPGEEQWAHVTLSIHSALAAVGFVARIATALARAGISLNPVAGFYHDHLFVPWSRRLEALAVLQSLAQR
jgi:uncharacterized protein